MSFVSRKAEIFQLSMKCEPENGRISKIETDELYEKRYLTLLFNHGTEPRGADYEYIVLPGYSKTMPRILPNCRILLFWKIHRAFILFTVFVCHMKIINQNFL